MDLVAKLSSEFKLIPEHTTNIITMLDEGNTVPFIARYRKEKTGAIDDQVLRELCDRLTYLRNLEQRKAEVTSSITEQGKMTPELAAALAAAETLAVVEDIYRPYKQKRKTRASVAIERGLQPFADMMLEGVTGDIKVKVEAAKYIDAEKGVKTADDALQGAMDIIAEMVSDNAEVRRILREEIERNGKLKTTLIQSDKSATYANYAASEEKVSTIPAHRILAINRGEKEKCLKVELVLDGEAFLDRVKDMYAKPGNVFAYFVNSAIEDSYTRLVFPSLERETRSDLFDKASEQAIKMFKVNLKPLLMQPPLKNKVVMGVDPAYRTGCKIAVIDSIGNLLAVTVVYPTPPQSDIMGSIKELLKYIKHFNVEVLSIGNGTATKETEIFVVDLIKAAKKYLNMDLEYIVVNEAGASVYSASKLGAEEFPTLTVEKRSAVSIARRLQDPLAELIKIDVKSIGVGQYQHDMPEKRLTEVLGGVVEDCVNSVGVDLNTASVSLLAYVAGLNTTIAKNIVERRKEKSFSERSELLTVPKLGPKAYEQCAGFLRIHGAKNVLDDTAVHPESYSVVEKLLAKLGYTAEDVKNGGIADMKERIKQNGGLTKLSDVCGTNIPTLTDIVEELLKPGRDIRDSLPQPVLRSDLLGIENLQPDMIIRGVVRNVIDFGAFVDIGVHQDGLVHISEICNQFISHPSDVLSVGDVVFVKVLSVNKETNKISLSIKQADGNALRTPAQNSGNAEAGRARPAGRGSREEAPKGGYSGGNDMASMLSALQSKFGSDNKRKK